MSHITTFKTTQLVTAGGTAYLDFAMGKIGVGRIFVNADQVMTTASHFGLWFYRDATANVPLALGSMGVGQNQVVFVGNIYGTHLFFTLNANSSADTNFQINVIAECI